MSHKSHILLQFPHVSSGSSEVLVLSTHNRAKWGFMFVQLVNNYQRSVSAAGRRGKWCELVLHAENKTHTYQGFYTGNYIDLHKLLSLCENHFLTDVCFYIARKKECQTFSIHTCLLHIRYNKLWNLNLTDALEAKESLGSVSAVSFLQELNWLLISINASPVWW